VRPRAKVTIDSLYEVVDEKSIGTKMNDLDICSEVVSRPCQQCVYCVTFDVQYLTGNRYTHRFIEYGREEAGSDRGLVPKDRAPIGNDMGWGIKWSLDQ